MDSEKIKTIVAQAKALLKGEQPPQIVMEAIVRDMTRSPNFAVAIYQHLKDSGVDLMELKGGEADKFRSHFKPQIEKLGEQQLSQLKRISSKLFAA